MKDNFDLKWQLEHLPDRPGVYLMHDKDDKIIYVGKASSLKNRVRQYFRKSTNHSERILQMISKIDHFEYIVTNTETEALVLESTLIKKYSPKYNILMKDGKTYQLLCVTMADRFPRLIRTHNPNIPGGVYFGPYPNGSAAAQVVDILSEIYPTRQCARNSANFGPGGKGCINWDIGKCPGPCMGKISREEYMERIHAIVSFLKGNSEETERLLQEEMRQAAEQLNFERAAKLRDRLAGIRHITEKQRVSFNDGREWDVFAYTREDNRVCFQVFFVRNGMVTGRDYYVADNTEAWSTAELLSSYIKSFYHDDVFVPEEVLLAEDVEDREILEAWLSEKKGSRVHISVPKIGERRRVIEIVEDNAKISMQQYKESIKKDSSVIYDALASLTRMLQLDSLPDRIESYDISNLGKENMVGVMIVFTQGKPDPKAYRRFKIKNQAGQDDYAAMTQVISRRFNHSVEEFGPWPDLVLLDGGRGHVNTIRSSGAVPDEVPVFGLVKDAKHRTRTITTDRTEFDISNNLQLMRFISSIQDEVHRYAISYQRSTRQAKVNRSQLDSIKGVGPKRKQLLYKAFGSMKAIKEATIEQLEAVPGIDKATAEAVYNYYHKEGQE